MDLYNKIIEKTEKILEDNSKRVFTYSENKLWPENEKFELVMKREEAFELGEKGSANYMCVTTDENLLNKDEVVLIGKELSEIKEDLPYARLVLVRVDKDSLDIENESEKAFRFIQKLDFVKYHVFPKGYMIRTSSENSKEQIRISKEALNKGICFEEVGNLFIKHYKEIEGVRNVRVVFLNKEGIDYDDLAKDSRKVHDITMTLSKILEGMPTDCSMCSLKPVCDEVEGMRELHFGKGNGK